MARKQTQEEREKAQAARPVFRFGLAAPGTKLGAKADGALVLVVDRDFRNKANVREAAAAWAGRHEVAVGVVVVVSGGSVTELLDEATLTARRGPHAAQSAAYSGKQTKDRK